MTTELDPREIIDNNLAVLEQFFIGITSGDYYDGTSYQLYVDLRDGELFENHEASDSTWLQRRDGSLILIESASGYGDAADGWTDSADIDDFGFADWLDDVERKIADAIDEHAKLEAA